MGAYAGVRLFLAVLLAVSGVGLVWVARATASGRLGRNPWAGIRTQATSVNDEAWLIAHRVARAPTEAGGWCLIVTALMVALVRSFAIAVGATLAGTLSMLVLVLYGAFRGIRAVR